MFFSSHMIPLCIRSVVLVLFHVYRGFLRIGPSVNRPMGLFIEHFPLVGPWAYHQQDKMTFYKKFWNRHNLIKSRHGDIINWKRTKLQTTLNVRFLSLSKLLFQIPKLYVLRPNLNLDLYIPCLLLIVYGTSYNPDV